MHRMHLGYKNPPLILNLSNLVYAKVLLFGPHRNLVPVLCTQWTHSTEQNLEDLKNTKEWNTWKKQNQGNLTAIISYKHKQQSLHGDTCDSPCDFNHTNLHTWICTIQTIQQLSQNAKTQSWTLRHWTFRFNVNNDAFDLRQCTVMSVSLMSFA